MNQKEIEHTALYTFDEFKAEFFPKFIINDARINDPDNSFQKMLEQFNNGRLLYKEELQRDCEK